MRKSIVQTAELQQLNEDAKKLLRFQEMRESDERLRRPYPRSRFIHRHVNLLATGDLDNLTDSVNCHILLDHFNAVKSGSRNAADDAALSNFDSNYGALVLYFPDIKEVLKINLRETFLADGAQTTQLGGFIRDLTDDRVHLRRLPRWMKVGGYLLFAFFGREVQVFHIFFSNRSHRLEQKHVLIKKFDQFEQYDDYIASVTLTDYKINNETEEDQKTFEFEFMAFSQKVEDQRVLRINCLLSSQLNEDQQMDSDIRDNEQGHILTCTHHTQILHELTGSYLTKIAKSLWTSISARAIGGTQGPATNPSVVGMGSLLAQMPLIDLHYDELNRNLFCVTEDRLMVLQINKEQVVVDINFKDEIMKKCTELIQESEEEHGVIEPMLALQVNFLASDLTIQDEDTMNLTIYANIQLRITSKNGPRSENLLGQFVLSNNSERIVQDIILLELVNPLNDNLLEGVIDSYFYKTLIVDEQQLIQQEADDRQLQQLMQFNHFLIFEQRQTNRIVVVKVQPHYLEEQQLNSQDFEQILKPTNTIATAVPRESLASVIVCKYQKLLSANVELKITNESDQPLENLILQTDTGPRLFSLQALFSPASETSSVADPFGPTSPEPLQNVDMDRPVEEYEALMARDRIVQTGGFQIDQSVRSEQRSGYDAIDKFSSYEGAISVNEFVQKGSETIEELLIQILESLSKNMDVTMELQQALAAQQQEKELSERKDATIQNTSLHKQPKADGLPTFQQQNAQNPGIFNLPDIPATQLNLLRVHNEKQNYCALVRERLFGCQGQQGYKKIIGTLSDIILDFIDAGISSSVVAGETTLTSHNISDSIAQKTKQIEVIMIFMTEMRLWQNEWNLSFNQGEGRNPDTPNDDFPLTQTILDFRIKLLIAKVMHESAEQIQKEGDASEIQMLEAIYQITHHQLQQNVQADGNSSFFNETVPKNQIYRQISNIDILMNNTISIDVINKLLAENLSNSSEKNVINSIYERFIKPVFTHLVELIEDRQEKHDNEFLKYHVFVSFISQNLFLENALKFYDLLLRLEPPEQACMLPVSGVSKILEFGQLHLKLLKYLEKMQSEHRDYILKILLEYAQQLSNQKQTIAITDRLIEMCKEYNAQQVLIKIVFDHGRANPNYQQILYQQIDEWGQDFLLLAMRVVYILEKRKVEQLSMKNTENQAYDGFQMIEIFGGKYYEQLKEFFRIINPTLMALLIATNLKTMSHNPSQRSKQSNIICNILLTQISSSNSSLSFKAKQSLASLGQQIVQDATASSHSQNSSSAASQAFQGHFLANKFKAEMRQGAAKMQGSNVEIQDVIEYVKGSLQEQFKGDQVLQSLKLVEVCEKLEYSAKESYLVAVWQLLVKDSDQESLKILEEKLAQNQNQSMSVHNTEIDLKNAIYSTHLYKLLTKLTDQKSLLHTSQRILEEITEEAPQRDQNMSSSLVGDLTEPLVAYPNALKAILNQITVEINTKEWKRHGLVYDTPIGRRGPQPEIGGQAGAADAEMCGNSGGVIVERAEEGIKMMRQSVGVGGGAGTGAEGNESELREGGGSEYGGDEVMERQARGEHLIGLFQKVQSYEAGSFRERALGCIVAAVLGDASGYSFSGSQRELTEKEVSECIDNIRRRNSPQSISQKIAFSDNTEVNISVMRALINTNADKLDISRISNSAFSKIPNQSVLDLDMIANMLYEFQQKNKSQQEYQRGTLCQITSSKAKAAMKDASDAQMFSNALVRTYPFAIWGSNLSDKDLKKVVVSQLELTTKEVVTQEAAFLYATCIKYLIANPHDNNRFQNAFNKICELSVSDLAKSVNFRSESCLVWLKEAQELFEQAHYDQTSQDSGQNFLYHRYQCTRNIGFVKHPLILTFYFMLRCHHLLMQGIHSATIFTSLLKEVLYLGGDTDTNATIVSSVLGAGLGLQALPQDSIQNLFLQDGSSDIHAGFQSNEDQPHKGNLLELSLDLLEARARQQLVVVKDED